MLELLFLLLPIAAAYGWYMGYQNARQNKARRSSQLSGQYLAGLNMLFTEQSDKAIEHFINLLEVGTETVDTHLALGNLFRQRGEVDRAIRIHENLISRSELAIEQKNIALEQLGQDYMASGFLDRAERIFLQLLDESEHRIAAAQQLVKIYQQSKDWANAIDMASRVLTDGENTIATDIGHFWCEIADKTQENTGKKIQYYKNALREDSSCIRANIQLGKIYTQLEDHANAIKSYQQVIKQDIDFSCEIIEPLAQNYRAIGEEQSFITLLQAVVEQESGASSELMYVELLAQERSHDETMALLMYYLNRKPTMKVFYRLIEHYVEEAEEGRAKEGLSVLQQIVSQQLNTKPRYQCRNCGFTIYTIYWLCPYCKKWGQIKPIRGLDGE